MRRVDGRSANCKTQKGRRVAGRALGAPGAPGGPGVPGVPGTGDLERSIRPDLGSVPSPASGLPQSQSWSSDFSGDSAEGGFIGSIGSLFFGRKGGLS